MVPLHLALGFGFGTTLNQQLQQRELNVGRWNARIRKITKPACGILHLSIVISKQVINTKRNLKYRFLCTNYLQIVQ